ncbi:arylamine N-acetyltransferase [Devosia algicola]|uniref:Arylamine N-acetyltransferase n=1 Tax=Devosia algicola TaxID=3026418 RepID=A0ABY7YLE7_9HYPH|nr:arylamine N-acetyltransferase [Devosia algicola]WDR01915.1 arylamine N-acetyltransferase [Devosia algicola]
MSEKVNIKAYFERIGFAGSIAPSLATLEQLHALQPAAIPFENLDPIIGLPVMLDQRSLEQKLLHNRRGGFCFELNTLFMRVLADLDYSVKPYTARVLWGYPEGAERPLSHMVLGVEINNAPYLVDVGFGSFTLTAPLKMRPDIEQKTPNETFRLLTDGDGFRLEVSLDDDWKPVYQFDPVERTPQELEETQRCHGGRSS